MSQAPTHQQIVQWYRDRPEAGRGDAIRFYRGWIGGNDNERAWKEARHEPANEAKRSGVLDAGARKKRSK